MRKHGAFFAMMVLACTLAPTGGATQNVPRPPMVAEGANLEVVYDANGFYEGPSWDPVTGKLYFTAFRTNRDRRILRLDGPDKVFDWLTGSQGVNGTFLSNDGKLLGAQTFGHRVMSYVIGPGGPTRTETLASDSGWNQPNDLCQSPNGNIYFTDPDFRERRTSAVYLLSPNGRVTKIIDDMPTPNGVLTSNDGKTLYVSDSHEKLWRSFPILPDGTVGASRVFFDPRTPNRDDPDGMTIDETGNLYLTGRGGLWVVSPEGRALGLIPLDVFCSNATFGGSDGRTLFLTCKNKVLRLRMSVRGGQFVR